MRKFLNIFRSNDLGNIYVYLSIQQLTYKNVNICSKLNEACMGVMHRLRETVVDVTRFILNKYKCKFLQSNKSIKIHKLMQDDDIN